MTHFAPACRGKRVQIECDNEAAIRDLVSCFSGRPMCLMIISGVRDLCAKFSITPRFEHILSRFNLVADRLSHDDFTQASVSCLDEFHQPLQPPSRLWSPQRPEEHRYFLSLLAMIWPLLIYNSPAIYLIYYVNLLAKDARAPTPVDSSPWPPSARQKIWAAYQ